MNFKKTFWMNVLLAMVLPLIYFLSYATDIDYVEHSTRRKLFTVLMELFFLAVPVITSFYLYKKTIILRKLALLGNYTALSGTIFFLAISIYRFPPEFMDEFFYTLLLGYGIFLLPFLINIKALKASYPQPLTSE